MRSTQKRQPRDGRKHRVPQLRSIADRGELPVAMSLNRHMAGMECYACHAKWTPQCYGCHAKRDDREKGFDWLLGKETLGKWSETRSYLRWETPVLGINARGKVSPFTTGCQAVLSHIDTTGTNRLSNFVFKTTAGYSGIAQNPVQPHTIRKEARTCEDCHANPKAVGLGTGIYDPKASGLPIDFEWERIVDEDGNQIQDTSHVGARPFNKEELQRIQRVGTCMACHSEMPGAFWNSVKEKWGAAATNEAHRDVLRELLRSGSR